MKIVITARNFTNYDRAAFESLHACGHEVVDLSGRDFTIAAPEADMIAALSDAQAAICGLEPITEGVLINIARGGVVDVPALRRALDDGEIGGAAIDVYESEPCTDSPLIGCDKAVLTPHTAPFTSENLIAMNNRAAQNVLDFFAGTLDDKYRLA